MVKEDLTSDRVNYLVWRYLQESNYPDTALTLAKEWNHADPRKDFDPGEHVKHQTLVTILQKGLIYDDLERSIRVVTDQPVDVAVSHGFFGPLLSPPTPPPQADDEYENAQKRSIDPRETDARQASPSKRQRLSNGSAHQNGFDVTPMDIDDHGNSNGQQQQQHQNGQNGQNGHAYPSPPPKEHEEPQSPINFTTNGPEIGHQPEKPTDLTPDTLFLSSADPSMPNLLQVLHCDWQPQDSAILAAAGDQALIHFWKPSPSTATSDHSLGHVNGASKSPHWSIGIDGQQDKRGVAVSGLSWSPSGNAFVVASDNEEDDFATVSIYNSEGVLQQSYAGLTPPVLSLDWNKSGTIVLGYSPTTDGDGLHIFALHEHKTTRLILPSTSDLSDLKLAWTGENEFIVCGGPLLQSFHVQDGIIELTKKHELREDHQNLCGIAYDPHTFLTATATEAGEIDIWNQAGERFQTINAHSSSIFALAWQPLTKRGGADASERVLASCSEDGYITLWDITPAQAIAKGRLTVDHSPVLSLAFSHDGEYLAGATSSRIMIWKTNELSVPKAYWNGDLMTGNESPKSGISMAEDVLMLKWDSSGERLAFAANTQIAIINFSNALTRHELAIRPQHHSSDV